MIQWIIVPTNGRLMLAGFLLGVRHGPRTNGGPWLIP